MVHLTATPEDALAQLRTIPHETCQNGIDQYWHVDSDGNVKAQSVCWLYCWGKTGLSSDDAAIVAQRVFDTILNVTFNSFDSRVPHEWAREARYETENIESKLTAHMTSQQETQT